MLPRASTPPVATPATDEMSSERLLNGRREILIRHGDRVYRLRHTSNDKLILTK
jgi:hemin uptake protein HemP